MVKVKQDIALQCNAMQCNNITLHDMIWQNNTHFTKKKQIQKNEDANSRHHCTAH